MQFRWWPAVLIVTSLFLSGCISQPSQQEELQGEAVAALAEKAGPRFLQQVDWPEPLVNGFYDISEDEEEVPGDMKDDSLLITDRGGTYWDYWEQPIDEGYVLSDLHGTPTSPVCVCDLELTFVSKYGSASKRYLLIEDSSWVLFDNVTLNGGAVQFDDSTDVVVTRSNFVDDSGVAVVATDRIRIVDNVFIRHQGPHMIYDGKNTDVPMLDECFPMDLCRNVPLMGFESESIVFEFNRIEAGTSLYTLSGLIKNVVVRHNSQWTSRPAYLTAENVEYAWNIVSGFQGDGLIVDSLYGSNIHNNSFIVKEQVHPAGPALDHADVVSILGVQTARLHDNDFLVAPGVEQADSRGSLLQVRGIPVEASRNYWGTLHDPRIPEGVWIYTLFGGEVLLDDWRVAPQHPIQIAAPFYAQEAPYWVQHVAG